jgi:hypothetical protein
VYSRREHLAYGKQCWDAGAEHVIKMDKDEAAYMPKGDKS